MDTTATCAAHRWRLTGRVQGVGFRPFVFRLAQAHGLAGWVRNLGGEVEIHVQGAPRELSHFGAALIAEAPPLAQPVIARQERATAGGLAQLLAAADASPYRDEFASSLAVAAMDGTMQVMIAADWR